MVEASVGLAPAPCSGNAPPDYASLWDGVFDARLLFHSNLQWGTAEELVLKLVVDDRGKGVCCSRYVCAGIG